MRKWHTKRAVPLDVVPKRRTKRCSPTFRPGGRFGAKFQIPVARQGGREVSAPRPYVTDPTHSLGSIHNYEQFLYICNNVPFISSMWYLQMYLGTVHIRQLRMRSYGDTHFKIQSHYLCLSLFHTERAGAFGATQTVAFGNLEFQCVICTGITLFALVLQF